MAALTIIEIIHEDEQSAAHVADELVLSANGGRDGIRRIANWFKALAGGLRGGNVRVRVDTTTDPDDPPVGTCTINSDTFAIVEDDTVTIGGVVFTWKASPSGESEVAFVNTDATDAAALAAKITAHSKLAGVVSATSAAGVVTVTALQDPRSALLITTSRAETNAGSVTWGAAALAPSSATLASQSTGQTYTNGG